MKRKRYFLKVFSLILGQSIIEKMRGIESKSGNFDTGYRAKKMSKSKMDIPMLGAITITNSLINFIFH